MESGYSTVIYSFTLSKSSPLVYEFIKLEIPGLHKTKMVKLVVVNSPETNIIT